MSVSNTTAGLAVTTPSSADNIPKEVQIALASFLCIALAVGIVGNLMTIYVITKRKKLRTHSNVYVANLAVADILLLSVNLPTTILEFFNGNNDVTYREYCLYTSPINIMTMICALNSVAAVGFNRYLLLCMTKSIYYKFTRRSSIALSIALIWIWSFCIVIPPMAGYGEFGYHSKFRTCFFKANDEESWMYGTIFCCVLGVFPPVIASTFFYGKILLKLAENKRNLMKHYKPRIVSNHVAKALQSRREILSAKLMILNKKIRQLPVTRQLKRHFLQQNLKERRSYQ
ncbi:hypothetical protein EB796_024765 [Bugula neritina]|uniref:G-protein coupled receptors family 1 profile domain-containing protein n=1 Tax=Bugula neritina TaxID=10212 RepID=A0A7J7ISX9_BUGNE|nr:hypothetical protein EB796_024765 [Bugula neritina]